MPTQPTDPPLLPPSWSAWRAAVDALVVALSNSLALFKNPTTQINPTEWSEKLNGIEARCTECNQATATVGNAAERVAVSRTLRRIQPDAEKWANRMVLNARKLNLCDADAIQRWHAEAMLPIDRLRLGLMRHDIQTEMEEEALRRGELPEEVTQPLKKVQRAIMDALKGQALTGEELAQATDSSTRSVARHIKSLVEERKLVKNDIKVGGYYRPDAPPR